MKRALHLGATLAASLCLALFLAACPAVELTIRVTETGVSSILTSCRGFQRACSSPGACADDPQLCQLVDGQCVLRSRCHLGDTSHVGWSPTGKKEGKLLLLAIDDAKLAQESPCFAVNPALCLGDRSCLADQLNEALDTAVQGGLTFDGFTEPDDALLVFAFFEAGGAGETACDPERLVACAGLAPPLGGGDYDVTCASCQDSSHFAIGHDNGPCPTSKDECFLERCERLLKASKK